jgi:hypothetical protein
VRLFREQYTRKWGFLVTVTTYGVPFRFMECLKYTAQIKIWHDIFIKYTALFFFKVKTTEVPSLKGYVNFVYEDLTGFTEMGSRVLLAFRNYTALERCSPANLVH